MSGPGSAKVSSQSFHEKMFLPPVLQWAIRGLAMVLIAVTLYAVLTVSMSIWEQLIGIALGTVIPLLLLTVHGEADVSARQLHLALRPFWRKRLELSEVVSAEIGEVDPISEIGVLGFRRMGGGLYVLALRKGQAVHIGTHNGDRYTVGVKDAASLVEALNHR